MIRRRFRRVVVFPPTNIQLRALIAIVIGYFCVINVYLNSRLYVVEPFMASLTTSALHPNDTRQLFLAEEKPPPTDNQGEGTIGNHGLCVLVGVMSRAKEFDLRSWHREQFQQSGHNQHKGTIQLKFPIAYDANYSSSLVSKEAARHDDIIFLPLHEGYRWLMANTLEFLHSGIHFMRQHNSNCSATYIVKADSDVLINYTNLLKALDDDAYYTQSLYFGLLQSKYPAGSRVVRQWAETSHSFVPPWAVGPFYGMTLDVAQQVVDARYTVLFGDEDMVPEEDRGVGIALQRGGVHVRHEMFMKELYLFCNVDLLTCKELEHFVAVHVGFGSSGSQTGKINHKLELLHTLGDRAANCTGTDAPTSYFIPLKQIQSANESLFYNCPGIQQEGIELSNQVEEDQQKIDLEYNLTSLDDCAETVYKRTYAGSFEGESLQLSGREYFLQKGYRQGHAYFCPRPQCYQQTNSASCQECDIEASYLRSYPDVAAAFESGSIPSAESHFANYGHKEGRVWTCHSRYQEPGSGSTEGCYDIYERFVNLTQNIVKTWPVFGQKGRKLTNKAVVFVEGRNHEWTDYSLRVARRYTGSDWMFYLIGPPAMCQQWRRKYKGPMITIVQLPEQFGDLSQYPEQINSLYKSKYLWEDVIQSEHVLFMQADALLLRHGIEDFFEFDFVGSPIFPESFPTTAWWWLCTRQHNCGGNGGLSLRRRSSMIDALYRCQDKIFPAEMGPVDEDVWFSSCMMELGKRMPHPVLANRFSIGSTCRVDAPLGFHKIWQNCRESTCIEALMSSHLFTDIYGSSYQSDRNCPEGNIRYLSVNDDVRESGIVDGWDHYVKYGKAEGRKWYCFEIPKLHHGQLKPYANVPQSWLKHIHSASLFGSHARNSVDRGGLYE